MPLNWKGGFNRAQAALCVAWLTYGLLGYPLQERASK
jgi:hypothetical protein